MPQHRTPGVYFERSERPPAIGRRRTDIAGFVGIAEKGSPHTPIKVESWAQFLATFGGHMPQGYLAYAVQGFFENGGATCWVVRVCDPHAAKPAWLDLNDEDGRPMLRLVASSPGTWGRRLLATLVPAGDRRFLLSLRLPDGTQELWRDLSLDPQDPRRYIEKIVNDPSSGSRLVAAYDLSSREYNASRSRLRSTVTLLNARPESARRAAAPVVPDLPAASDGLETLTPAHFSGEGGPVGARWGLANFEGVDEISIIAIPDLMNKPVLYPRIRIPRVVPCTVLEAEASPPLPANPPQFAPSFVDWEIVLLQQALVAHCIKLKDRVAILDPLLPSTTRDEIVAWRGNFDSSYGAVYYPWLQVPDPLELQGLLRPVPPSGHVAGVYARNDLRVGVHKAPANEVVELAEDLATIVDDVGHGLLNTDWNINVIRPYPGRGIRVFGARTLSSDSEWYFVNVRRLLIMIEEAIDEGTQWTVFEPNNPSLWREMDRIVRSFLDELWRRGMLDGARAEDAYFVCCDETTNTPEETAQGRMICVVGVQPPWPAEFVVVRIGKTESGVDVVERNGG